MLQKLAHSAANRDAFLDPALVWINATHRRSNVLGSRRLRHIKQREATGMPATSQALTHDPADPVSRQQRCRQLEDLPELERDRDVPPDSHLPDL